MPEKVGKEWVPDPSDAYYREQVLRAALRPSAYERGYDQAIRDNR